ncbi:MAG: DsbE family thiol:disulfide interchange protein [Gammaproteobacteria bacterium]|nr:DsbE family thiol:disulfide interchange protein [Gammaproteobacteria bacterium]
MLRYLLPAALFAVLVVFLGLGLNRDPSMVPSPLIDKPAPAFSLPHLKHPAQRFTHRDLRGNVSLVNVWATWCVACYGEHPVLVALARSGQVPIYGLNLKDKRPAAIRWLRELGDPYAAIAFDADGRVAIDWGVYGAPETFVVDSGGIIRYKHIGPLTAEVLTETILPLVRRLREG